MDVVVVGSCNTDLISYVPRLPKAGETVHGTKFCPGFGGKGANQCVAAARLGCKTAMLAKVGSDNYGTSTITNFKENGINTDFVYITSEASTGVAPIFVDDEGQNAIVVVCGANMLLTPEDVIAAESLISSATVVVCQLEIKPETTITALKLAAKHKVKTIFNSAPAMAKLDSDLYKVCDIFCANETEAEMLTDLAVTDVEGAKQCLNCLLDKGCQTVIITMGSKGSVFASKDDRTPKHVPVQTVSAVDTTGAGDAFVGALAFYLSTAPKLSLEESIRRASCIATVSVQSPGTQTSFPRRPDLPESLFIF